MEETDFIPGPTDGNYVCADCLDYCTGCSLCGRATLIPTPDWIKEQERELTDSMKPIPDWLYYH